MQIRRTDLIAAIDAALTGHDKAMNEYRRQVAVWKAQRRADWDKKSAPRWKALRNTITTRLRNGKPVTAEDVKTTLGADHFGLVKHQAFVDREPNRSEVELPTCPADRLKSLRAALVAIADDSVTPSALKGLGFRDLEWVFTAAIKNGGAVR